MSRNQWFDGKSWGYECGCGAVHSFRASMSVFACNCGEVVRQPTCTLAKPVQAAIDAYSNTYAGINRQHAAVNAMSAHQARQDQVGARVVNDVAVKTDNARLRKELEAAMSLIAKRADLDAKYVPTATFVVQPFDHETTISKLRAFSEDQARQVQRLEEGTASLCNDLKDADSTIARLTRELDKLKRAK